MQCGDGAKGSVAGALFDISASEQHCGVVVSAGGAAALVGVLQEGSDDAN